MRANDSKQHANQRFIPPSIAPASGQAGQEIAGGNEKARPDTGRAWRQERLLMLAAQGEDRAQGQQAGENDHAPFGKGGDGGRCDLSAGPGS